MRTVPVWQREEGSVASVSVMGSGQIIMSFNVCFDFSLGPKNVLRSTVHSAHLLDLVAVHGNRY